MTADESGALGAQDARGLGALTHQSEREVPPATLTLWFCPACGREIKSNYGLDTGASRCVRNWHRATAVGARYKREAIIGA